MEELGTGKAGAWERALEDLGRTDLKSAAAKGLIDYEESPAGDSILLSCFGYPMRIAVPGCEIVASSAVDNFTLKVLALRYISKADNSAITGEWVAYRDLPGGMFYAATIPPTVEEPLAEVFGAEKWALSDTAPALNGKELEYGDESFAFYAYPRVPLMVVLHWGKDEFPPSVRFLFDRCVSHYLNTDDCKVLATQTASMLIKLAGGEYQVDDASLWMVD